MGHPSLTCLPKPGHRARWVRATMLQAFSDSGGVGRRQAQSADESRTCLPADMVRTRSCRGVSPLGPAMSLGITCPLPSPPLLEGCWAPYPAGSTLLCWAGAASCITHREAQGQAGNGKPPVRRAAEPSWMPPGLHWDRSPTGGPGVPSQGPLPEGKWAQTHASPL